MLFKQQLISRILSEANDLKRTPAALAKDLNMAIDEMDKIMQGDCSLDSIYDLIDKMGAYYPIDKSDLMLIESDCTHCVKFMRKADSENSARIFNRKDKNGDLTPYYEYRDTIMSRLSPFKPEWIKELRVVDDNNPENPDVVYNNGHFMHQMTFFIGPVNFYWEVDGQKHCVKMNTGDSNYITPYWRHSFAARSSDELCLILAITFGSEVRRAQKEIYALGDCVNQYVVDYRHPAQAIRQMILNQMKNENYTAEHIQNQIQRIDSSVPVQQLLSGEQVFTDKTIALFARVLNIEPSELKLPDYKPEEEVVVAHSYQTDGYEYPSKANPKYLIKTLARSSKMPHMKGFDIQVNTKTCHELDFECNLHSYIYNYSDEAIQISWEDSGKLYNDNLMPGDSVYLLPFVKHAFCCHGQKGKLFVARVSGAVNIAAQKELSYFSDISRAISEQTCWFSGK